MKRTACLAMAALLAGTSVAAADPYWNSHEGHWNRNFHHRNYAEWRHHDHADAAAAIGLGVFALGAIALIAAQNDHQYDRGGYIAYPDRDAYGPYWQNRNRFDNPGYNYDRDED